MSAGRWIVLGLVLVAGTGAAQECPRVTLQSGEFESHGAALVDTEALLWCATRGPVALCRTVDSLVRFEIDDPFATAERLATCGRSWVVQRGPANPYLIRKDRVAAVRWDPRTPAVAWLDVEGRRLPIRVPLERPYCLKAAALLNFYADDAAAPLCEPQ